MKSARDAVLDLLNQREVGVTICPSEVARSMATDDGWRELMGGVHRAVDGLLAEGMVTITWKGLVLANRDGPYRIGRGSR